MSEQLKDKCAICGSYLFDDDDIVYCPECGAPHHRDCYNAIGHCGRADMHEQLKSEPSKPSEEQEACICKRCKKALPENTNFCPYCGTINKDINIDFAKLSERKLTSKVIAVLGHIGLAIVLIICGKIDGIGVKEVMMLVVYKIPLRILWEC